MPTMGLGPCCLDTEPQGRLPPTLTPLQAQKGSPYSGLPGSQDQGHEWASTRPGQAGGLTLRTRERAAPDRHPPPLRPPSNPLQSRLETTQVCPQTDRLEDTYTAEKRLAVIGAARAESQRTLTCMAADKRLNIHCVIYVQEMLGQAGDPEDSSRGKGPLGLGLQETLSCQVGSQHTDLLCGLQQFDFH